MFRSAPEEFPPDFGLYDRPARSGRTLLLVVCTVGFVGFVLGGLIAGLVFLDNFRVLTARRSAPGEPTPAGSVIHIPVVGSVALPELPRPALPARGPQTADKPQEDRPPLSIILPTWEGNERLNVLLLGIDHRDDEPMDGSRSDTLMVVSVDPVSKSVVMISLPRDLWVSIPGYGEQRINVAHSLGGPELAMRTVAANFGLRVNHYARIDFRGFEQIVNTLGGIQVDAERPVKDDEYPTEDYSVMRLYIAPGPQWMDGRTALQYARSRHSENDFGRARRQQRVLMAIRERAIQANMIFKAPELVPLAQKTLNTSFGPLEMIKLARLSMDVDRERIGTLVVDTNYAWPQVMPDGAEVLVPNRPAIQGAIQQAFNRTATAPPSTVVPATPTAAPTSPSEPTVAAARIRVEVLNGTSRSGLAAATADWLRRRGFEVVAVGSAERMDYPETRLLAQPGHEGAAGGLASALGLPGAAVQSAPAAPDSPDIRLILGQNYQLPAR